MRNRATRVLPRMLATILAALPLVYAAEPTVSNVRASQRVQTQLVDVFYDLSAEHSGPFRVSLAVSTNNGLTYDLPASSFSGMGFGAAVTPGTRKQILWNAGADWPGQYSSAMRFKVRLAMCLPPPPAWLKKERTIT